MSDSELSRVMMTGEQLLFYLQLMQFMQQTQNSSRAFCQLEPPAFSEEKVRHLIEEHLDAPTFNGHVTAVFLLVQELLLPFVHANRASLADVVLDVACLPCFLSKVITNEQAAAAFERLMQMIIDGSLEPRHVLDETQV